MLFHALLTAGVDWTISHLAREKFVMSFAAFFKISSYCVRKEREGGRGGRKEREGGRREREEGDRGRKDRGWRKEIKGGRTGEKRDREASGDMEKK